MYKHKLFGAGISWCDILVVFEMLAMAAPKKPQRLSEKVVRFPKILECDSIELDSLDECSDSGDQNVSKTHPFMTFKSVGDIWFSILQSIISIVPIPA